MSISSEVHFTHVIMIASTYSLIIHSADDISSVGQPTILCFRVLDYQTIFVNTKSIRNIGIEYCKQDMGFSDKSAVRLYWKQGVTKWSPDVSPLDADDVCYLTILITSFSDGSL